MSNTFAALETIPIGVEGRSRTHYNDHIDVLEHEKGKKVRTCLPVTNCICSL